MPNPLWQLDRDKNGAAGRPVTARGVKARGTRNGVRPKGQKRAVRQERPSIFRLAELLLSVIRVGV